ncbi:pro-FMRFamide-related neuropeptide FF isoform X2 [Crotalus tigris]|uniref:pro-FMRFamide-related neuropeptide FF isoform X2 n=1 Tax=Crotalus tigris TaxID=88082 RepID=UPI00192F1767|nr:pro-FMRFamide-related neuropeptide FF isoform X2 [Crotalus tigris]
MPGPAQHLGLQTHQSKAPVKPAAGDDGGQRPQRRPRVPRRPPQTMPQEGEEHTGQTLPDDHLLGILLRTLFHAAQRPGRSPSFLFQPQRFGREARTSSLRSAGRIKPRAWDSLAPQFLSLATPQRFGKKK